MKKSSIFDRLWLPAAKFYCKNLRMEGPATREWVARANRELRYDRWNRNTGKHSQKWSESMNEKDSMLNHVSSRLPGKHAAYGWDDKQSWALMAAALPWMMSMDW